MWIFETPTFADAIHQHGLRSIVDSKGGRIEDATTRAQASRLLKSYAGFLVARHANFRLIGGVERVGATEVFCWYEVLPRGGPEYRDFASYSRGIRQRVLDHRALKEWFLDLERREVAARQPAVLPGPANCWLEPITEIFESAAGDDDILFETREWMRSVAQLKDYLLPDLLECVSSLEQLLHEVGAEPRLVRAKSGIGAIAQRTEAKALFLIDVVLDGNEDLSGRGLPLGEDALRLAGRAYPTWILADPTTWYEVERGEPLNLALSPEERELLRGVGGQGVRLPELPLFINGHAGSGKSTMLAYIFAGLCKRMVDKEATGLPLFVTYSDRLLSSALRTTRRILAAHPDSTNGYSHLALEQLFTSWTAHLLRMLPDQKRARFDTNKRVDFHDFKLAWEGVNGKLSRRHSHDERSAELVWHVIRTLIKGSDLAGDLHPDDYALELTRLERTVTEEDYRRIFQDVYNPWYKAQLEAKGLWDDQDLIEAVLEVVDNAPPTQEISALVVDEAQDFTRRELRLITRTTMYSEYAVPRTGTGMRPPIIFAGDPLQTLSPTGFRWGAVKAGIFEELQGIFGDDAHLPTFKELVNNYRSQGPIVRLANAIQLWRAVLFTGVEVKPQRSWQLAEEGVTPEKFILDDVPEAEFMNFARDTIIIVPCEEGGELAFIRSDPILSKMFPDASDANQPDTVFTAVGIKGLEYAKVILYKFGEALPGLRWEPSPTKDKEERDLAAEYFFNKLYVAATRATQSLYVADTMTGDENLWSHLAPNATGALLTLAQSSRENTFSIDDLGAIDFGHDLSGVRELNPRENAMKTREYSRETRNPRQMRKAASFFRRMDELQEADLCDALALEFEGDLQGAGTKYVQASSLSEAWRCFWAVERWDDLNDLAPRVRDVPQVQRAAVRLMGLNSAVDEDLLHFASAILETSDPPRSTMVGWSPVVDRFAHLVEGGLDGAPSSTVDRVAECLNALVESGFESARESAAQVFLRAGNRTQAKRLLSAAVGPMTERRARLLAELGPRPESLEALIAVGLRAEVVRAWNEAGRPLDGGWSDIILAATDGAERIELLIQLGRGGDALTELTSGHLSRDTVRALAADVCRAVALTGSIKEMLDSVESISTLGSNWLRKSDLYNAGLLGAAQRFQADGWSPGVRAEAHVHKQELQRLYEDTTNFPFKVVDPESVPAYGTILELAGLWGKARNLYDRFVDSDNPRLRNYCRHRFLASCTDELEPKMLRGTDRNRLQNQQHEAAKKWNIDLKKIDRTFSATIPAASGEAPPPKADGSYGSIEWSYRRDTSRLSLTFDDGVEHESVALERGKEPRGGNGLKIENSRGDLITVTCPGIGTVEVEYGSTLALTITPFEGETRSFVLAVLEAAGSTLPLAVDAETASQPRGEASRRGRPAATRRTTQAGGASITKNALANELKIRLTTLGIEAKKLDIPDRRGNEKYTTEEQMQIRAHFAALRSRSRESE